MTVLHIRTEDQVRRELNILAATLDISQGEVLTRALAALRRQLEQEAAREDGGAAVAERPTTGL